MPYTVLALKLRCEFRNALLPFATVHLRGTGALCVGPFLWWQPCRLRRRHACRYRVGSVAFDPLHFGVRAASLLHLLHTSVRSQLSFGAPPQVAVKSLVVSVQLRQQAFGQDRSGQTLSNHNGIIAQRSKEFAQRFGLFRVTG